MQAAKHFAIWVIIPATLAFEVFLTQPFAFDRSSGAFALQSFGVAIVLIQKDLAVERLQEESKQRFFLLTGISGQLSYRELAFSYYLRISCDFICDLLFAISRRQCIPGCPGRSDGGGEGGAS